MKTQFPGIFLVCLLSLFVFSQVFSQNWPMVNGNKERTSWVQDEYQLYPPLEKLEIPIRAEYVTKFENVLYVSQGPNEFHAYDLEKQEIIWTFIIEEAGGSIGVNPAVSDSIVLCGGQGGKGLLAIGRKSGTLIWSREIGSLYGRHPIIDEDRIYIVKDNIVCLDLFSGNVIWSAPVTTLPKTPSIDENNLYICSGGISAYDKFNGNLIWHNEDNCYEWVPIMVDESNVYGYANDVVKALDKTDGSVIWTFENEFGLPSGLYEGSMAISDNVLVFSVWTNANNNGHIVALNKNAGTYLWDFELNSEGAYTPTIANKVVYVINFKDGTLHGLKELTGEHIFEDSTKVFRNQAIVSDEFLFVPSRENIMMFWAAWSSLEEPDKFSDSFCISPNPSKNEFKIYLNVIHSGTYNIELIDLWGRSLKNIFIGFLSEGQKCIPFDLINFPNGQYFCNIKSKNGVKTLSVLKN